jgi:hypothetical protein
MMCKNSTLKGTYGFYRTGTHTAGAVVTNIAAAGFMVFDGTGGISAYQNASTSGVFVANNQNPGFYHVYKNCVFTLSHVPYTAVNYDSIDLTQVTTVGVIVDEGKELYALSTEAGRAVLFIAKKM